MLVKKGVKYKIIVKIEGKGKVLIDEDLEDAVLRYMDVTRRSAAFDQDLQELNTWDSYIEFLEYQEFQRQRLIDEDCAYAYRFNDGGIYSETDAENERGICYVQK